MKRVTLVLSLALAAGLTTQAATAQTLKTVKDRGMLSCGVSQGLPGFSAPDDKGNWAGAGEDRVGIARVLVVDQRDVSDVLRVGHERVGR